MHQTLMGMLQTTEIDVVERKTVDDIVDFFTNATWVVCSTYNTVLEASPGEAIF